MTRPALILSLALTIALACAGGIVGYLTTKDDPRSVAEVADRMLAALREGDDAAVLDLFCEDPSESDQRDLAALSEIAIVSGAPLTDSSTAASTLDVRGDSTGAFGVQLVVTDGEAEIARKVSGVTVEHRDGHGSCIEEITPG